MNRSPINHIENNIFSKGLFNNQTQHISLNLCSPQKWDNRRSQMYSPCSSSKESNFNSKLLMQKIQKNIQLGRQTPETPKMMRTQIISDEKESRTIENNGQFNSQYYNRSKGVKHKLLYYPQDNVQKMRHVNSQIQLRPSASSSNFEKQRISTNTGGFKMRGSRTKKDLFSYDAKCGFTMNDKLDSTGPEYNKSEIESSFSEKKWMNTQPIRSVYFKDNDESSMSQLMRSSYDLINQSRRQASNSRSQRQIWDTKQTSGLTKGRSSVNTFTIPTALEIKMAQEKRQPKNLKKTNYIIDSITGGQPGYRKVSFTYIKHRLLTLRLNQ